MFNFRSQAIWELCRQGYPMSADEAEMRWSSGAAYRPEPGMHLSRALRILIDRCNDEVSAELDEKALN